MRDELAVFPKELKSISSTFYFQQVGGHMQPQETSLEILPVVSSSILLT